MANQNGMTREIPRAEWQAFFDGFSQQHEGWLVTLEVLDRAMGAQIAAENLPLQGITADLTENENVIMINVGETIADHTAHAVTNPTRVQLKSDAQGAHEALEFETAEQTVTLMRFRVPALPETVDGVMTGE